jgi:hypothetical protein
LVYKAVAADNMSVASCDCILGESFEMIASIDYDSEADGYDQICSSPEFGCEQGSSRWDCSEGTINTKMGSTSSLVAPSRPELTPSKDNLERTRPSRNSSRALPEWLRQLPIESQT